MNTPLRDLVDDLPTESLDLFVLHYEQRMVSNYMGTADTLKGTSTRPCCPRAALGFPGFLARDSREPVFNMSHWTHPAYLIERLAYFGQNDPSIFDLSELYRECLLSLVVREAEAQERQAVLT